MCGRYVHPPYPLPDLGYTNTDVVRMVEAAKATSTIRPKRKKAKRR